jgi:hypothetical protein
MENIKCPRCEGNGKRKNGFFGRFPDEEEFVKCHPCRGVGTFEAPDFGAIVDALVAGRSKNKGKIRASAPKYSMDDRISCRIYYVWRLFRFYAGMDVTMPVVADTACYGDPCVPDLDKFAATMAFKATGRISQGMLRWGSALGAISGSDMTKLSMLGQVGASAQSCGFVADDNKPEEERIELY